MQAVLMQAPMLYWPKNIDSLFYKLPGILVVLGF